MPELGAILTAIVTPFDERLRVDEEAFAQLLHHVVDRGSDGVVAGATTGEAPTLSDEEQIRVIALAVDEIGDRATVVAGTGSNETRHAVHLTERATELGVDATLSVTPYYNKPNRRGIVRHFEEVSRATDKPVLLYNIPQRTGVNMPNDLLAQLAQIEHVEGVKQANPDDVQLVDGLDLYAGNDDMLCEVLDLGGTGGVLVGSHIVGEQMRQMVDEPERRREIDAELSDLYEALSITTNPIPIKAALNLMGHQVGGLRLPLVEASEREVAAIRAVLDRHGLLAATTT
jgi:4-hydroxy-tetrahydrodipicolinate synthase